MGKLRAAFISSVAVMVFFLAPQVVVAEIFKCKSPGGKTEFRDQPCDKDQSEAGRMKTGAELREEQRQRELMEKSREMSAELKKWQQVEGKCPVCKSAWDGTVPAVDRYLRNKLGDSDAYDLNKCGPIWSNGVEFRVVCDLRVINGFGVKIPQRFMFVMLGDGVIGARPDEGKHVAFQ